MEFSGAISRTGRDYADSGLAEALLPGDANRDGVVDGADYTAWADGYGQPGGWENGDFDGNGWVNGTDYTIWAQHYGTGDAAVPEPAALSVLVLGAIAFIARRPR